MSLLAVTITVELFWVAHITVNVQPVPGRTYVLVAQNHVLICVGHAMGHVLREHIRQVMPVGQVGRRERLIL